MNIICRRCHVGRALRYTNSDGSPRTTSSSTKNASNRSGASMIECTSRFIPDTTKKTGMKKP